MRWLTDLKKRGSILHDFIGKVVVIRCGPGQSGGVFEEVHIVKVGFSPFVVGRKVMREPPRQGSGSNVTCWFGINEVKQMDIYDNAEDAWWAHERAIRYPWLSADPDSPEPE